MPGKEQSVPDGESEKSAVKSGNGQINTQKNRKVQSRCEDCEFYEEGELGDAWCNMSLDEDEMAEFLSRNTGRCPYYRYYNEYKSVRKQN